MGHSLVKVLGILAEREKINIKQFYDNIQISEGLFNHLKMLRKHLGHR